jgi:hypothetical protein
MAEDGDLELSELEAVDNQPQPNQDVEQDVELPDKFKGKSTAELAKLLVEIEGLAGKQANEVGEVRAEMRESRKLMDDLLRSQIDSQPAQQEEVPEVDFFENPQEAIRQAVESNPKVMAAERYSMDAMREQNKQRFFGAHPDAMDIVQNPRFRDWVNKSTIRKQLLQRADANFDVDSANELLGTWKELNAVNAVKDSDIEKQVTDDTIRSVSVDTGGSGDSSKKTYTRAKLILLKTVNPRKYESMRDEIELAYREKRVR